MTLLSWVFAVIFLLGCAAAIYAWRAPRAPRPEEPTKPSARWTASTDWTKDAGAEFSGLSETARCDLIFAVSDLDDERSRHLLEHALDDPAESVLLAAAHALVRRGDAPLVEEYAREHPGERAQRMLQALTVLGHPHGAP